MVKSNFSARAVSEDGRIAAAALALAAKSGWGKVTIDAVARAAKLSARLLQKRFTAPHQLVPLIAAETDREAFAGFKSSGTPHDILFDLLMARFDILQKHRAAILSMADAARHDLPLARMLACATLDSVYRVIDLAKLDTPPRPALAVGISTIYAYGFYVWRKDESRDMPKTMAALDRALRYAGKAAAFITRSS